MTLLWNRPLPSSPQTATDLTIVATAAAAKTTQPTDPYASRERHHNEGHGRRLTAAFEALEAFPMLAESRNRVLRLFESGEPSTADVVAAVEADVALASPCCASPTSVDGRTRGRVESAVKGVEVLSPRTVHSIAEPGADVRLLRAHRGLAGHARALPPARGRHPARRRPARPRARLRGSRPADGHLAAARHRQARAGPRLSRLSAPDPRRGAHPRGADPVRAPRARRRPRARSAASSPAAGACPSRSPA